MILMYMTILLVIFGLTFILIGITKKNKIFKNIGIIIFTTIIVFWIGFTSWALYKNDVEYKSQIGQENLNKNITNIDNEKLAIEHYTKNLENIPRKFTVEEAVKRNYFVYDAVKDKFYNEDVLEKFVKNTEMQADNRITDEIIIVIYNINGDPSIYNLGYGFDENMGYILAKDSTRIDIGKTELPTNDPNYKLPDEFSKIVVDTNFPKEHYSITVIGTGFSSNAICLKSHSENYEDVEIARYIINNN